MRISVKQALLPTFLFLAARCAAEDSDPNHVALRSGGLKRSFRVENVTVERDLGKLTLQSGTVDFLAPVLGRRVIGVFVGDGEFRFKPSFSIETAHLKRRIGRDEIQEPFRSAVLCFTDDTYEQIEKVGRALDEAPRSEDALREFRSRMRQRTDQPRSMLEAMLGGEDAVNIEAELLGELYDTRALGTGWSTV